MKSLLAVMLLLVLLIAAYAGIGQAQEPPPAQTPAVNTPVPAIGPACDASQPKFPGGQVVRNGPLEFTLPLTGIYAIFSIRGGPAPGRVKVCHLDSESFVIFSAATGETSFKTVTSDAGNDLLDEIIASVRLHPEDGVMSAVPGRPGIRAPDTGDAGMR